MYCIVLYYAPLYVVRYCYGLGWIDSRKWLFLGVVIPDALYYAPKSCQYLIENKVLHNSIEMC